MNNLKKYYVYEWYVNETGEVFYVGKGSKNRYKTTKRENEFFTKMLNNHNCSVRKVYTDLTEEVAFIKEIELIKHYRENTNFRLTNISPGGNQPPVMKGEKSPTKRVEVRNKISIAQKNIWETNAYKIKMSKSFKDFYATKEGKEVARKRTLKNWESKEFRNKIIESLHKTMRSEEFRKKHSIVMQKAYSSEVVREKVRGANNGNSRRIKQYDLNMNFIKEFSCLTEAEQLTGFSLKNISKALNGHNKTAFGFIWKFSDNKKIVYKSRGCYKNPTKRNRKPIAKYDLNMNLINEYESISDAIKGTNMNSSNIICNLKGKTKTAYKHIWKYK